MNERRAEYDPAKLLTWASLLFVGILIVFISAIIGIQIMAKGTANTESWAALTGIVGWVTGTVSMVYNARYGTSKQAEAKDAVIAQQSRAASTLASGSAQTIPAAVDTVNVAGDTVNVTEKKP